MIDMCEMPRLIAMTFFDNVRALPPCKVCGSREAMNNDIKVDWSGKMKGEWTCKDGHRNVL